MITLTDAQKSFFVFIRDTLSGKVTRIAVPADMQVGLVDNPAALELFGRLSLSTTVFQPTLDNKQISINNEDTIASVSVSNNVTASIGRVTAFLPSGPRDGQVHFIKDATGTAGIVPIDVSGTNGQLIDGQLGQTISSSHGSMSFYWALSQWSILVGGGGSSGGGAPTDASYVTINNESGLTNERKLTAGTGVKIVDGGANSTVTLSIDNNIVATVSGTTFTGPVSASGGLTGSLQQVSMGLSYLVAGSGMSVSSQSNGQVVLSSTGGSDPGASYVVISNTSSLSNERALAAGNGITITDGGANSTVTIASNGSFAGGVTGSWIKAYEIDFQAQPSGSLTGSLPFIIDGKTWFCDNFGNADSVGILPSTGLVIDPKQVSVGYSGGTRTAPLVRIPISSLVPSYSPMLHAVKVDCQLELTGSDTDFDTGAVAIEKTQNTASAGFHNVQIGKQFNQGPGSGFSVVCSTTVDGGTANVTPIKSNADHDVVTLIMRDPKNWEFRSSLFGGASGSTGFVDIEKELLRNMATLGGTLFSATVTGDAGLFVNSLPSGSNEQSIVLVAATSNSTDPTFQATFKRMRVFYKFRDL